METALLPVTLLTSTPDWSLSPHIRSFDLGYLGTWQSPVTVSVNLCSDLSHCSSWTPFSFGVPRFSSWSPPLWNLLIPIVSLWTPRMPASSQHTQFPFPWPPLCQYPSPPWRQVVNKQLHARHLPAPNSTCLWTFNVYPKIGPSSYNSVPISILTTQPGKMILTWPSPPNSHFIHLA
jgi:hypothetical protein